MAVWLPSTNKFYLPPRPITRVSSTDEYVKRTDIFYHVATERLLTVGHPYFEIKEGNDVIIPKVSPNQYRVFRLKLADPNTFAFGDSTVFDPENERLVWAVRGIEVGRGQPLGIGVTGHPYTNKLADVENPLAVYENGHAQANDERKNQAFDPKQTQMFIIGARPAEGEHWVRAKVCTTDVDKRKHKCPPIELKNTTIQDGDMMDIGLGNLDFLDLQEDKSEAPLDVVNTVSKYPDYLKMHEDKYGDSMFFYVRREQLYARHVFNRSGVNEEDMPDALYIKPPANSGSRKPAASNVYEVSPSGSLVSTEGQLFNRPYWVQRSAGQNNGILWGNELFCTIGDNTRGTTFNITVNNNDAEVTEYQSNRFNAYVRHVEEYQVSLILQLCKVPLTPENLAFLHTMDPKIIDRWHLSVDTPTNQILDQYRYIKSLATKCPDTEKPKEEPDPYAGMKFWDVDLSEHMTDQLDQTALGRKFLFQTGLTQGRERTRTTGARFVTKRVSTTRRATPASKRRRT
ncbi:L1 [Eidolon helvum papillomavirus 1]|uniref:Major capsid protein L1 n=2 Tax=Eidolon helvum papillomavirus 1 TaxID=1163701 RepID=S4TH41_9PAPI|nr:L1 [Eidolon helvum papillomavirus 1]AGB34179.1 L1 [Eidolon helvum papillomavirus 1]